MRFLKVNIYHPHNLSYHLDKYPLLYDCTDYDEVLNSFLDEYYWTPNSLEKYLRKNHDYDTNTLICTHLQVSKELDFINNLFVKKYKIKPNSSHPGSVLFAQIKYYNPDILYISVPMILPESFMQKLISECPNIKLYLGFHCNPDDFSQRIDTLKHFDVLFGCNYPIMENLKKHDLSTSLSQHAFDSEILDKIEQNRTEKEYDVVFAGHLDAKIGKTSRIDMINALIKKGINVKVFAQNREGVEEKLLAKLEPPMFGLDLYKTFANSKVVLNKHDDFVSSDPCNVRMFDTTGIGSLLVTDRLDGKNRYFEEGKEIVCYSNYDELTEKVSYYLKHDIERELIAKNGQNITLAKHNYENVALNVNKWIESNL